VKRVWIDTDIGSDVDDAVALLCAARHPEIHLIGVSTVTLRVEIRTWLARRMLECANTQNVTVLPGSVAPVTGEQPASVELPSHGRLAPGLPPLSPAEDGDRIDAIAQAMIAYPEPFHLLTIGPLTNIARLLDRHPGITERWASLTCMAGHLETEPEYNVRGDAAAARLTFERLGPSLVGLEASSETLSREEAEAALDPADPASAFLLDCYREYRAHPGWHRDPERAPLTLFDAITLLSLVVPEAFDFQALSVLVEKDGRMRLTDDGAPVTYALSSDWAALEPRITALLRGELA